MARITMRKVQEEADNQEIKTRRKNQLRFLRLYLFCLDQKENKLRILKRAFEELLKAHSVSTLSGKALLLLEELQHVLYANLIQQVEADLNIKFRELIRKADFFSRIVIDDNFTVHILRDEEISTADIISLLRGTNYSVATGALGSVAIKSLQIYVKLSWRIPIKSFRCQ